MKCGLDDEGCGKHSGIPPCCREWFIRVWAPYTSAAMKDEKLWWDRMSEWKNKHLFPYLHEDEKLVQYIRCPGCKHTGTKIELRECKRVQEVSTPLQ